MRTTARRAAAYLFLAVAWGFSFLVLLKVVQAFGTVGAVTFRTLLAGSALLAIATALRKPLDFSAGPWRFAVVGSTTVAGQLLGLSLATPRIGTAMTAIFVATIPLFSMAMGQFWGLERVTPGGVAGLALGIVGIVLLVGFPAVPFTGSFLAGCVFAGLAALSAAFGSHYANRHLRGTGSWEISIGAFLAGGLMTLPLLALTPVPARPALSDYGYLLVLGGLMSATTYVLFFRLVAAIGATRAISVEFAVTLVAVLVGALVLGEPLSAVQVTGGIAVVGGCTCVLGVIPRRGISRA